MGIKGNLSTVDLSNVFQTLRQGNSTGLLRIQAPEGPRFVELQNGAISIAGRSSGRVLLGDLLISRGLLDDAMLEQALNLQKESGKLLGEVLIENSFITYAHLEEALKFQIEEEVCELFTLRRGEFDFLDNAALDARIAPAGGLVRLKIDLNALLVEAARRADEWKAIEQRIPSQTFLFKTTPEGDALLQGTEGLSPEGMILLRLVKTHRTVEAMVQKACLGRFNTNRMLLELWDAGIIEAEPLNAYEKIAREHMRMNRHDEAQRVAEFANEFGSDEEKELARAVLADIEKTRKPASTTSALNVKADPKVRSEVIRRNQPNLMMAKQKSYTPLIAICVLALAAICGGLYYTLGLAGAAGNKAERARLDQVGSQAQEKITEDKYNDGLKLLLDFRSEDADVQKDAKDLYEKRLQEIESKLTYAADKFKAAQKSGNADELNAAIPPIQKFAGVQGLSPQVLAIYNETRAEVDKIVNERRTAEFTKKLADVEAAEKPKGSDALAKAYTALLAETPPESIAGKLRDHLYALDNARFEAERSLKYARSLVAARDTESARIVYERVQQTVPGTPLAADAEKELADVVKSSTDAQSTLEKLEGQINKPDEVRPALLKFMETNPPYHLRMRALTTMHGLKSEDESQLTAAMQGAQALWDKQPAEARKRIVELVAANPFSKTALLATLKVKVATQPDGANVLLNGRQVGVTPVTIDVPASTTVRLSIMKEGFRSEEIARAQFRDEAVDLKLERLPQAGRRLPVVPNGGMAFIAEKLMLAGAPISGNGDAELAWCARNDLSVTDRVSLAVKPDTLGVEGIPPPSAILNGEIFLPTRDKYFWRINPATGSVRQFRLEERPTSLPEVFSMGGDSGDLLAMATARSLESYNLEDNKPHKAVSISSSEKPSPFGIAYNGDTFVVPRIDGIFVAVAQKTGLKKWEGKTSGEITGSPACFPPHHEKADPAAGSVFVLASKDGTLAAYDNDAGTEKWKSQIGEPVFGVTSLSNGVLVLKKDGKAEVFGGADGKPVWSTPLGGEPVIPALVVRAPVSHKERLVAVAAKSHEAYSLNVLDPEKGTLLWSVPLRVAPLAITASNDRLYVGLSNADVLVFDIK